MSGLRMHQEANALSDLFVQYSSIRSNTTALQEIAITPCKAKQDCQESWCLVPDVLKISCGLYVKVYLEEAKAGNEVAQYNLATVLTSYPSLHEGFSNILLTYFPTGFIFKEGQRDQLESQLRAGYFWYQEALKNGYKSESDLGKELGLFAGNDHRYSELGKPDASALKSMAAEDLHNAFPLLTRLIAMSDDPETVLQVLQQVEHSEESKITGEDAPKGDEEL